MKRNQPTTLRLLPPVAAGLPVHDNMHPRYRGLGYFELVGRLQRDLQSADADRLMKVSWLMAGLGAE